METKSRKNEFVNRESWNLALWRGLDPIFAELSKRFPSVQAPEKVRIGNGFPAGGKQKLLATPVKSAGFPGEAYHPEASADGHAELFIAPHIDDPLEVAGIIVHLRLLVSQSREVKHGREFREPAIYLGLEGRMRHAMPDEKLRKRLLEEAVGPLGPYPHAKLDFSSPLSGKRPQQGRQRAAVCMGKHEGDPCGFSVNMSRSMARDPGPPLCPRLHGPLTVQWKDTDDKPKPVEAASRLAAE